MGRRVYVGNLSYNTTTESLREAFNSSGEVVYAKVVTDRETGQSRGFGFVEFASDDQANQAIQDLNGADLDGRRLRVNIAEDKRAGGAPAPSGAPKTFSGSSGRPVDVYQSRGSSAPRSQGSAPSGGRDSGRGRRRDDDDGGGYGGKWR